ncbi:CPBP family intramembrane glutamic endopeptidase [Haloplanus halobius]|uniref:CPBP family intramembrane glutamic endopeptidase n=1 Tax=Haloplanus halobius TaxID=2934938 RepID=UPI00200ED7B5|nr:type II CAAX endopeptidase family protein [Haloplanus sp. XH21]
MSPLDERTTAHLRAVVVALVVSAVGLGVGLALVYVLLRLLATVGVDLSPARFLVVSLVAMQGLAFGGVALGYLTVHGWALDDLGVRVPNLRDLLVIVAGYAAAIVAAISGAVVITITSVPAGENQVSQIIGADASVLLWLIPASFLLIGPGEELLFRGIVQSRLRESFDAIPGVVLASAIFAAIHYIALTGGAGGRLVTVTVLFFPALVFGAVYELTDNLVVPALVHGAYNATLFAITYLAIQLSESGAFPDESATTSHLLVEGLSAVPV